MVLASILDSLANRHAIPVAKTFHQVNLLDAKTNDLESFRRKLSIKATASGGLESVDSKIF